MVLQERATVGDEDVRAVIEMLMGIVKNPKANYRSKTSAARVLVQYKRLNLDSIRTAFGCEKGDIEERLEELEAREMAASDRPTT